MTVLENVLEKEYSRSLRLSQAMKTELESLPKGSIRTRSINGHNYYYLTHREGKKVKTDYVPATELDSLCAKLERRRDIQGALKEQEHSQQQIVRALGRVPHAN